MTSLLDVNFGLHLIRKDCIENTRSWELINFLSEIYRLYTAIYALNFQQNCSMSCWKNFLIL